MVPDLPAAPHAGDVATPPTAAGLAAEGVAATADAEERRILALRETRQRLEADIAELREEAARRQRELPGRKVIPDTLRPPGALFASVPPAGNPAAATPPAAAPGDPALRGLRVFVHHRTDSAQGAASAEEVSDRLREAGVETQAPRTAPFVPSTPVVRFFHDEDQAAAARIAGRLGRGWAIQDFRAYQPQPAPQTIEIWVPGG